MTFSSLHILNSLGGVIVRREEGTTKPAVIGIAAAATALVVVLIGGLVFCFFRRRGTIRYRNNAKDSESMDEGSAALTTRTSKMPLMQTSGQSRASSRGPPASENDEEANIISVAPSRPRRALSASTTRSLPPSYAAAIRASIGSKVGVGHNSDEPVHRPSSRRAESDGLRPLLLVDSQRSRSRSGSPEQKKRDNDLLDRTPRPRPSISRFHEEDLDG